MSSAPNYQLRGFFAYTWFVIGSCGNGLGSNPGRERMRCLSPGIGLARVVLSPDHAGEVFFLATIHLYRTATFH
jgi:hypothetical protein